MSAPAPEQLLLEVEEVIRTMPAAREFSANPDKCVKWLGRASAAMHTWDPVRSPLLFEPEVQRYSNLYANRDSVNFVPLHQSMLVRLHQAQSELRLQTAGPLSVGLDTGRVFEYFDELRKIIESARSDLLFVDPYMDAEFVSRYLPLVPVGTAVRLLARHGVASLKPAVAAFIAQNGHAVAIRTAPGFHDRYLFVDARHAINQVLRSRTGRRRRRRCSPRSPTRLQQCRQHTRLSGQRRCPREA